MNFEFKIKKKKEIISEEMREKQELGKRTNRKLKASKYIVRHVTIADGGHRDDGPPEGIRDGFEVG